MSDSEQALLEVKKLLLGYTSNLTESLKDTSKTLEEKLHAITEYQRNIARLPMIGVKDEMKKEIKEKLANTLDTSIEKLNAQNAKIQKQLKNLSATVQNVTTSIKPSGRK